jgi:hypothetical protein
MIWALEGDWTEMKEKVSFLFQPVFFVYAFRTGCESGVQWMKEFDPMEMRFWFRRRLLMLQHDGNKPWVSRIILNSHILQISRLMPINVGNLIVFSFLIRLTNENEMEIWLLSLQGNDMNFYYYYIYFVEAWINRLYICIFSYIYVYFRQYFGIVKPHFLSVSILYRLCKMQDLLL